MTYLAIFITAIVAGFGWGLGSALASRLTTRYVYATATLGKLNDPVV